MKTLIIGTVPENYNEKDYEVFAPYCFLGREKENPEWDSLNYKSVKKFSQDEYEKLDKRTAKSAMQLIDNYSDIYNLRFGVNYSIKFWKKILFPWFLGLVTSTYERQTQFLTFVSKSDQSYQVNLVKDNIDWNIKNTNDFFNVLYSVLYNDWLLSRIIEKEKPAGWILNYVDKNVQTESVHLNENRKFRTSLSYLYRSVFRRVSSIYGFTIFDDLLFELLFRTKALAHLKKHEKTPNRKITSIGEIKWVISINQLIKCTEPNSLRVINKRIKQNKRKYFPGKIILGSQLLRNDDDYKLKVALAIENGEFLVGCQHGGDTYGITKHCEDIYETEYNNYGFITWGWSSQSGYKSNFIRLPSPYLTKYYNKHHSNSDEIILVGTRAHLFNRFFNSHPQIMQWIEYRRNKLTLLKALIKTDVKQHLFYRPYFKEHGSLRDYGYFKEHLPELNILEGDLHSRILSCRLLILDHPGTTLNIAMSANIPTLLFWDDSHFPFSERAKPYFDQLKKAGILFNDINKIVETINTVNKNIDYWWTSSQIQRARLDWCENYAHTSQKWFKDWKNYFIKIDT